MVLVTDLASAVDHVPEKFVRPISDRPTLSEADNSGDSIPLIDLRELHGSRRTDVVLQLAHACHSYGFFQIKNHGVPETTVSNMLTVAREFFRQPESERLRHYTADTTKTTRLSTSFNVNSEKVSNWRDFLRLHCHPLEEFRHEWPSSPPSFRDTVAEYSTAVRKLVLDLLEAISESLGLSSDGVEKKLGGHGQHMAINYYPPCPQPELTFGLPGHTDPNLITVLLQDDVSGLQVFRNGKWVSVHPVPNTFIVNIGDQMQVISNDKYKSVLHRAVVNSEKERISIPTFYCPSPDAVVGPADELITDLSPSVYRSFSYSEYYDRFWNRGLANVTCLDLFKASSH
ncbi:PREDICTED: protein DMR6-LIKE OXYGENASE 2-like [Tarenaya hassleriana]|uniref:protein DMR6-LIKE OXYGENASE 2-like n=1 Tax=Tarenaya hassleriana TaxID=28532 RepID=UPI00053C8508|nr:PREDICTED: protein DMR6-LIKE OXYGENASE 2-like [Tarenaya hassleriana]